MNAHRLVIEPDGDETTWEIVHPPGCGEACPIAFEVENVSLDSLDVDWRTLACGEYEIDAWHVTIHIPMVGTEYDGGLKLLKAPS